MNLKPFTILLVSIFSAPAFAHSYHDDQTPQASLNKAATEEASGTANTTEEEDSKSKPADAAEPKKNP